MEKILRRGDRGSDVAKLQAMLCNVCNVKLSRDGIFGRDTERVLRAFQVMAGLLPDGIYGPQSEMVLLSMFNKTRVSSKEDIFKAYYDKIMYLVNSLIQYEVVYGPGRGLFVDGKWIVTWGPGATDRKEWKSKAGAKKGPSFHCSSLVNFVLSYLVNRNEDYTHAGNVPTLFDLIAKDNSLHPVDPTGKKSPEKYRGFGGRFVRLASDGDTIERLPSLGFDKAHRYLDAIEVIERKDELGPITVWSQSTKKNNKYLLDHHVGFFIKNNIGELYRFASDGSAPKGVYSCTPISYGLFDYKKSTSLYQLFKFETDNKFEHDDEKPSIVIEK